MKGVSQFAVRAAVGVVAICAAADMNDLVQPGFIPEKLVFDLLGNDDGIWVPERHIGIPFDKWIGKEPENVAVRQTASFFIKRDRTDAGHFVFKRRLVFE